MRAIKGYAPLKAPFSYRWSQKPGSALSFISPQEDVVIVTKDTTVHAWPAPIPTSVAGVVAVDEFFAFLIQVGTTAAPASLRKSKGRQRREQKKAR